MIKGVEISQDGDNRSYQDTGCVWLQGIVYLGDGSGPVEAITLDRTRAGEREGGSTCESDVGYLPESLRQ